MFVYNLKIPWSNIISQTQILLTTCIKCFSIIFLNFTKQRYFEINFLLKLGYFRNYYFGRFTSLNWLSFQNLIWSPWEDINIFTV